MEKLSDGYRVTCSKSRFFTAAQLPQLLAWCAELMEEAYPWATLQRQLALWGLPIDLSPTGLYELSFELPDVDGLLSENRPSQEACATEDELWRVMQDLKDIVRVRVRLTREGCAVDGGLQTELTMHFEVSPAQWGMKALCPSLDQIVSFLEALAKAAQSCHLTGNLIAELEPDPPECDQLV